MIHNVYVFDENGTPLLTVKAGSIEADSVLLTGFLSAMQSFSKKITQGEVERINIKDYDFHIRKVEPVYVALVADKNDGDAERRLDDVCKIVAQNMKNFADNLVQTKVKEAVTKRIGFRDRAKNWAEAGL
nr:hypothetical protein [Candidatus Njordarchaeum guaymaensis]